MLRTKLNECAVGRKEQGRRTDANSMTGPRSLGLTVGPGKEPSNDWGTYLEPADWLNQRQRP